MPLSYLYALGSNLTFSLSTIIYTSFSRKVSILWMNCFKTLIALFCAALWLSVLGTWEPMPTKSLIAFLGSGILGLNIGDIFMLSAFIRIGPGRTMMLWGFQPLFLGLGGYFFFGQPLTWEKFIAVGFFFACLFVISHEKYKEKGSWELKGLLFALIGTTLDASGILLSRYGYDQISGDVVNGHFYRCLGSALGFGVVSLYAPINLTENFRKLNLSQKGMATFGAFLGTFLALWFYLSAIRIGHLQSIAAISVTSPVFASIFESIYLNQKPTKKLLLAFFFFLIGFSILLYTN